MHTWAPNRQTAAMLALLSRACVALCLCILARTKPKLERSAVSYDEEMLTFSRRGLAITQHLQHSSEPQPWRPMGTPLSINSLYTSM